MTFENDSSLLWLPHLRTGLTMPALQSISEAVGGKYVNHWQTARPPKGTDDKVLGHKTENSLQQVSAAKELTQNSSETM